MSQDLAFVEQQLIRAMAEPQMDQSLSHTLGRLRELRGVVASILARHTVSSPCSLSEESRSYLPQLNPFAYSHQHGLYAARLF